MPEKPYGIGIAGPSCAGKGELSKHLARVLHATVLPLDTYYYELADLPLDARGQRNFDHPDSFDRVLLCRHTRELLQGNAIECPVYDFTQHARNNRTERVVPARFVIIEGLFALYWAEVRELLQTRMFIDASDDVCLARRLERDIRERGRTADSVREQWIATVRPMAEHYVLPTRRYANVMVNGCDSIVTCATAVLQHIEQTAPMRNQQSVLSSQSEY
jgi:uridine kinase